MQRTIKGLKLDYVRNQRLKREREILTDCPENFLNRHNLEYLSEISMIDEEILDAIDSLPETQRLVIKMTIMHDFTTTKTAENLGTSQQNVSRLRNKALSTIRKHLERWSL